MQKNAFFELFLQLLDSYLMYLVKERLRLHQQCHKTYCNIVNIFNRLYVLSMVPSITRSYQFQQGNPQMWTRLSSWAPSFTSHGLHFRVYNVGLAQALLNWHATLGAVGEEEEAEVLRTLIKKKGVVLEMVIEDNQVLNSAVNCWNEKNKEFSE